MNDSPKTVRSLGPYEEALGIPLEIRIEDQTVVFSNLILRFSLSDFEQLNTVDIVGKRVSILKTDIPNRPIIVKILDSKAPNKDKIKKITT